MNDVNANPSRPITFRNGGWLLLALALISVLAMASFWWQRPPRIGDGRHVESYGFDLAATLVPRQEILAGGMPRDYFPVPTNPKTLTADGVEEENRWRLRLEKPKFLVGQDRVVGVVINGEARAYSWEALSQCEAVNDVVGARPILITCNPLCQSVVVLDRTASGRVPEFATSGLVYNSAQLLYDRGPRGQESLWCPLQWRAIAGPAAGTTLEVLPFELASWAQWKAEHPRTRVMAPDPAAEQRFDHLSYAAYLNNDELKFPVNPAWDARKLPRKTPVVAVNAGAGWKVLVLPRLKEMPAARRAELLKMEGAALTWRDEPMSILAQAEPGKQVKIVQGFLFAWYAMHPGETALVGVEP